MIASIIPDFLDYSKAHNFSTRPVLPCAKILALFQDFRPGSLSVGRNPDKYVTIYR
jgi:hypothetical protein